MGETLGCGAHIPFLTRTCCWLTIRRCSCLGEEIAEKVEAGQLDFLHPLVWGTGDLVKVFLTPEEYREVHWSFFIKQEQTDKELAAFEDDKLLAILEKRGNL